MITLGVKAADYSMVLNQYQDNGKTVGCLGGTASTDFVTGAPICIGGAQFVTHSINYNNWPAQRNRALPPLSSGRHTPSSPKAA